MKEIIFLISRNIKYRKEEIVINRLLKRIVYLQKIDFLKKIAFHGVSNRNQALLLINGEVFLAEDHPAALFKYLREHNLLKNFVYDYYTTYYKDKFSPPRMKKMISQQLAMMESKGQFNDLLMEAIWEYGTRDLSFTKIPIALGHYIKNIQGKEKIALIIPSLTNIVINDVIQYIINKFPNAIIIDDDTDEILYTPNKNFKMDIEESWFVINIDVLNYDKLKPLNTSIFDTNLRTELSYINNFKNCAIEYYADNNFFILRINITLNNINANDKNMIEPIFEAVRNAVLITNKYFQNNNIDNHLKCTNKYMLEY